MRDGPMRSQKFFASILIACLLPAGLPGLEPVANAASAGRSFLKRSESARTTVIAIKHHRRGPRIHLPIGPAYIYYDYPYYYSRGHYPTHIGGYVYYPAYYYSHRPIYGGRCHNWRRRCAANRSHY